MHNIIYLCYQDRSGKRISYNICILFIVGPVTMFLQPASESRLTNARERREVPVYYNMHSILIYVYRV